ncbi:MAG: ABC transporter ATP-binding protein [Chloroflexota bacterium]
MNDMMPTAGILLKTENLTKEYVSKSGTTITAIKNLNIYVKRGEFVTLLGPSGCGKTTTFNIIAGLLSPTRGSVYINNQNVTGKTGYVGYMFQKDLLLPWRTVIGNVLLGVDVLDYDRKKGEVEAVEIISKLGLAGREESYPAQLSGGMRQRVAFGRTLMFHKDLLLLDEPLGALDSQTREYMQEWLMQVWSEFNKTILLVSHDLNEAILLSDRIYVLTKQPGEIKAEIKIDLPRPRGAATRISPQFGEIHYKLNQLIREEETSEELGFIKGKS